LRMKHTVDGSCITLVPDFLEPSLQQELIWVIITLTPPLFFAKV
jgi:hypothetical protein